MHTHMQPDCDIRHQALLLFDLHSSEDTHACAEHLIIIPYYSTRSVNEGSMNGSADDVVDYVPRLIPRDDAGTTVDDADLRLMRRTDIRRGRTNNDSSVPSKTSRR